MDMLFHSNEPHNQMDRDSPIVIAGLFPCLLPKIQQTKMLVTCQKFGDLFLFGLVWQYSTIQKNIVKVGSKSWILTCSCYISLSLP